MVKCKECNFFEEDEDLTTCNHPEFEPAPFGFDVPEVLFCDGFERYQVIDDLHLD